MSQSQKTKTMNDEPMTARTITDSQIRALRAEAGAHGDAAMVRTCDRALAGRGGRGECARAIADARAMAGGHGHE